MSDKIIALKKVTVNFNGFKAINQVDFCLKYGELRMLIGPNGAGKTTLLDVISGKVKPVSGRIVFKEKNICVLPEYKIARLGVARKFQTPTVFVNLTVFENMELALNKEKGILSALVSCLMSEDKDKIFSVLKTIGLEKKIYETAGILSHGEKQWLELGMSLVRAPALLLIDEPVAGMTGKEREKTGELLLSIAKERTVLVVEHDMQFVRRIAEKVTVLHEGRVLCEGSMDDVQNNPMVIKVYLGRTEEG